MAASATQNPPAQVESKSAKKKKAKLAAVETVTPVAEVTPSNGATESNNGDVYESPYMKELQKSIRSVNKKITNASKVDNVLAENPGKSLDDLVSARKINADQKAQILKKPQLQASLSQLEEQIAQYKKFDLEYKTKTQAEKAEFEKTHTDRAQRELDEAVSAAKAEAESASVELLHRNLLTLTKFLQLAAIRRSEEEKADLEDSKALEGLLTEVYAGNDNAVTHMLKLMKGSTDTLRSPTGDELTVTYADIQTLIAEQSPPVYAEPEAPEEPSVDSSVAENASEQQPVQNDPTLVNAGLTELDAPEASAMINGHTATSFETQGIPANAGFGGEGGANAAAEANWDQGADMSASQEWVEVPRDATETDTGVTATTAAPSNVQSWADDQPDSPGENTAAAQPNEGFQEIKRATPNRGGGSHRGGGRGRGEGYRGRGRGEGYRGRGGRGGAPRSTES